MCSWLQDSTDNLDWHRWYGRSPDLTSGPQVDHANTSIVFFITGARLSIHNFGRIALFEAMSYLSLCSWF